MPFNQKPQKFNANINTVEIGCGDKAIKLGGESTFPFYSFDAPVENAPKVGVEISDTGIANVPGIQEYYAGATTMGEIAKKAEAMEGADFVCLRLEGGDPNGEDKPIEDLIAVVKEVGEAVTCPLVVEGCKNVEKDAESSRSTSGQKCFDPFCKRRKLQSGRCSCRSCLQSESRRRICCRYQPGKTAERSSYTAGCAGTERSYERRFSSSWIWF